MTQSRRRLENSSTMLSPATRDFDLLYRNSQEVMGDGKAFLFVFCFSVFFWSLFFCRGKHGNRDLSSRETLAKFKKE